jgi:hypothetical protein
VALNNELPSKTCFDWMMHFWSPVKLVHKRLHLGLGLHSHYLLPFWDRSLPTATFRFRVTPPLTFALLGPLPPYGYI